jgi:hypothetical protein
MWRQQYVSKWINENNGKQKRNEISENESVINNHEIGRGMAAMAKAKRHGSESGMALSLMA